MKTDAINTWIDTCYQRYPNGFVAQVPQGDVPARSQSWAMEVAKDVVRPPLSVRLAVKWPSTPRAASSMPPPAT